MSGSLSDLLVPALILGQAVLLAQVLLYIGRSLIRQTRKRVEKHRLRTWSTRRGEPVPAKARKTLFNLATRFFKEVEWRFTITLLATGAGVTGSLTGLIPFPAWLTVGHCLATFGVLLLLLPLTTVLLGMEADREWSVAYPTLRDSRTRNATRAGVTVGYGALVSSLTTVAVAVGFKPVAMAGVFEMLHVLPVVLVHAFVNHAWLASATRIRHKDVDS